SGSEDNTVCRWNLTTGQKVFQTLHGGQVLSLALAPNGKYLAAAGHNGVLQLLDPVKGTRLQAHQALPGDPLRAVAFSPDSRVLALGGANRTIYFQDPTSGAAAGKSLDHGAEIYSLAYSTDGKRLVAAGARGTLCVWDVATRKEVVRLTGHEDIVASASF